MQFDGLTVKQGSSIQNLVVASGTTFPTTANDGQLFYIKGTGGGNAIGMFVYEAVSSTWIRQLSIADAISTLLPSIVTPGTYNNVTVNAAGLVTAGTSSTAGVTSLTGTSNVLVSASTGAVTLSLPSIISSSTTGTASTITGTYAGTLTSLQITNALGYTPLQTAQTISIAGDAGGSGTSSITLTLNTVNPNVGTFGSSTSIPVITVNGKGLLTSITTVPVSASGGGSGTLTSVAGTAGQITATTTVGAVTLSLPSNVVIPTPSSGTALTLSSVTGTTPLGITINSGANTAMSVTGPAATNLSVLTFQQSGQNALLLYNPASTSNINFFNSVHGDLASLAGNGGMTITAPTVAGPTLQLNTNNTTFAGDSTANSILLIANSSSTAQSAIDFAAGGSLRGRVRSDYVGNMSYVVTGTGVHDFWVGGDATVGTTSTTIGTTGLQTTSLGVGEAANGVGNIYATGGLGITGGATFGGIITRSNTGGGYLNGSYSSVETGATAGAIYSIGGSYTPKAGTTNPLGNMYGIGFTTTGAVSGSTGTTTISAATGAPTNQWGCYIASNGVASIFLDSDNGTVYAKGLTLNGTTGANITSNVASFGSIAVSGSAQGWAGTQYASSYQTQTFMASTTTNWSGVYSVSAGAWDWYITNGTLTGVSQLSGNAATASLAAAVSMPALTSNVNYDMVAAASATAPGYLGNITGNPATGTLTATNIVGTTNVTSNSDERLKTNIKPITDALDKVKKLTGVNFNWKDSGKAGIGLIAQNVQEVVPEAVVDGEHLSVAYGNLVGLLMAAVNELAARVEAMENK